jgi:putative flippase GtrA
MKALLRAQLSASVATAFDLAITVALVSGAGIAAPLAGATGSVVGGGINFTLNRRWAYNATARGWRRQVMRYLLVWCGYVLLSYGLLRLGVDMIGWHYLPVKLAVMALLAVGWNHLLHRRYEFAA